MNFRLRRQHHSLSARLTLLFVGMAILFLLLVGGTMGVAFRDHFQDNLRPHLAHYLEYIRHDIGIPPDFRKAADVAQRLHIDLHIFSTDRDWSSNNAPLNLATIGTHLRFSENGIDYRFGQDQNRHYLISTQDGYTFVFSLPDPEQHWGWRKTMPLLVLLLILVLLYHATRRLFAPIQTINAGIARIGEGELDYRIQIHSRDELGELARNINAMADEIQQMLEAKRQLLLAISHELRAPLTHAKLAVEMLEDIRQRDEIQRDLNEMASLITGLLETERLRTRHSALNKSKIEFNELAQTLVAEHFPDRGLILELPSQPLVFTVDAVRLKLLLNNLLDNALRHTPEHASPPRLSAKVMQQEIVITVEDSGPGVAEQHLPHLTEPFYRADPSRQRQTGGYGLGLYLCRVIAEAHGGKLEIDSKEGHGMRVIVHLPI